jgi:oxaloacetate decarboxylase alpha subunit
MMNEINFIDTTFRDGHASLWAEKMTTSMMLPVAEQMDRIGFKAMELTALSHFKKCIRELNEDPWDRVRSVSKIIKNTPLSLMMHCSITAFDVTPLPLLKLWLERIAANGINRLQLMEPSNDMSYRVPETIGFAKNAGLKVAMALVYSESPKHTEEYYARKARDTAELDVDAIYLKDPGGLLTPERTRTLIPILLKNMNGKPFELHSHCTTGLAPLCYLEAAKLGVTTFHTSIPPLANGSAQPSVFNIAGNVRYFGYTPTIDVEAIKPISDHFMFIAKRDKLPIGSPLEYDPYQYVHQVPGGVISNLRHQLSLLNSEDRLEEVFDETVKIREELGYPIMVTPFSQFVVSQAFINVMLKERYKEVTDELMQYALGFWGKEASSSIDPNIKDRIIDRARAKELSSMTNTNDMTVADIRKKFGGEHLSDDDLLLLYIIGEEDDIKKMRASQSEKKSYTAKTSLMRLIQELTKQKDSDSIFVQKGDFSISLKKNAAIS